MPNSAMAEIDFHNPKVHEIQEESTMLPEIYEEHVKHAYGSQECKFSSSECR